MSGVRPRVAAGTREHEARSAVRGRRRLVKCAATVRCLRDDTRPQPATHGRRGPQHPDARRKPPPSAVAAPATADGSCAPVHQILSATSPRRAAQLDLPKAGPQHPGARRRPPVRLLSAKAGDCPGTQPQARTPPYHAARRPCPPRGDAPPPTPLAACRPHDPSPTPPPVPSPRRNSRVDPRAPTPPGHYAPTLATALAAQKVGDFLRVERRAGALGGGIGDGVRRGGENDLGGRLDQRARAVVNRTGHC